jgi:hypothetical protein
MKTGKLLALLLIVAVGLLAPGLLRGEAVPADVQQAAAAGLPPFLSKIPANALEDYGFARGDDLKAASLGSPFQVQTITPAALEKYQAGMTVAALLTPTTVWYFPVVVNGQYRAILAVDQLNGKWQAVSLGFAGLAKELGVLNNQWKAKDGFHPVLIVVFQAQQYLFTVPEKDAFNLTRLSSKKPAPAGAGPAAVAPVSDYAVLGTAADAVGQLKTAVKNSLKGAK